jgi:hypothetical protein
VLYFFPTAQKILNCEAITNTIENNNAVSNFYCHRANEVHEHQKTIINPFVNGTTCPDLSGFGFFQHTSQRSKYQKAYPDFSGSHFLANVRTERPTIKSNLANQ